MKAGQKSSQNRLNSLKVMRHSTFDLHFLGSHGGYFHSRTNSVPNVESVHLFFCLIRYTTLVVFTINLKLEFIVGNAASS